MEVHVIGSCATELYLPDSDIDLVVRSSPSHPPLTLSDLHQLGAVLQPLASSLTIISTASVPLIKLTHAHSSFTIDLTLEVDTGLHSTSLTLDYLDHFDTLQPLAIVVKQFLKARNLNDLYTGGLPSYTLILLIVSFLQLYRPARTRVGEDGEGRDGRGARAGAKGGEREERKEELEEDRGAGGEKAASAGRRQRTSRAVTPSPSSSASPALLPRTTSSPAPFPSPSPPSPLTPSSSGSSPLTSPPPPSAPPSDLGLYLLSFFHLYGLSFDYTNLGISTAMPGYFSKRERGFFHPHIPFLLCVENPLDRSMDLGFKVFRIREIVDAFAQAYAMLVDRMGMGPGGGGPTLRRPCPDIAAVAALANGARHSEHEDAHGRQRGTDETNQTGCGGGGGRNGRPSMKVSEAGAGEAVEPSMSGASSAAELRDSDERRSERGTEEGHVINTRQAGKGHSRRSSDGHTRGAAAPQQGSAASSENGG